MTDEFAINLLEYSEVLPNSKNLHKAQEIGADAIRMRKNIKSYIDKLQHSSLDKEKCLEYLRKYVDTGIEIYLEEDREAIQ